jgi:hypothetical protein
MLVVHEHLIVEDWPPRDVIGLDSGRQQEPAAVPWRRHLEGALMTYLSPGVYVEEVESGARPLEGVGTAVASFVGLAPGGPLDSPALRVAAGAGLVVLVVLLVRRRRTS